MRKALAEGRPLVVTCYRRRPEVAFRLVENETILIEPTSGAVLVLNAAGGAVWGLLSGWTGLSDLAAALAGRGPSSNDRVPLEPQTQIASFLQHLQEHDLLETAVDQEGDPTPTAQRAVPIDPSSPLKKSFRPRGRASGGQQARRDSKYASPVAGEVPAIIFAKQIEAVAATCAFDPPLTKAGGGDGCTGLTFS